MAVQLDHDELVQQYQNAVHRWEVVCKRADRYAQQLAGLQLLHGAELQDQKTRGYGQIYNEYHSRPRASVVLGGEPLYCGWVVSQSAQW